MLESLILQFSVDTLLPWLSTSPSSMTQWDIDPQKFRARLKPNWGDTSGIPLGTPPCNLPKSRQSATCHTIWSKYNKGSFRSLSTDIQSVACRVPCIPSPARVRIVIPWGSRYESTDCPMCEAHMKQLNNNNNPPNTLLPPKTNPPNPYSSAHPRICISTSNWS